MNTSQVVRFRQNFGKDFVIGFRSRCALYGAAVLSEVPEVGTMRTSNLFRSVTFCIHYYCVIFLENRMLFVLLSLEETLKECIEHTMSKLSNELITLQQFSYNHQSTQQQH